MQITITISEEEYKALKKSAEIHLNSMSKEARVIIRQNLFNTVLPGYTPTPTYIPHGAPGGIPAEPYKITLQADTTTPPLTSTKTERELHPEWFNSDGKKIIIGGEEQTAGPDIEPMPAPTPPKYIKDPIINDDDPEPEWDADRGGARPRVR